MVALRCPPTPGKESMETRKITNVPLDQIDLGPRCAIDVNAMRIHVQDLQVRTMKTSIKREGLHFPVLLTSDLKLIDGLRRVEAYHEMGLTEIPAFITNDFVDAIDYLIEMNKGYDIPYVRMGQIMMEMRPMMLEETARSRSRGRWRTTDPPRRHGRAREAYAEAFHESGTAAISRLQGLYLSSSKGNPRAVELVKQMEAGIISPHQAYSRLYARPFFKGDVIDRAAQESLLRNTTQHLSAVIKGLTKLQSPVKVRPEVAQECLDDLRLARATLISAIRELEKETEQA